MQCREEARHKQTDCTVQKPDTRIYTEQYDRKN